MTLVGRDPVLRRKVKQSAWFITSVCLMAGALSAVDVQDLAGDERCRLRVKHAVLNVGHGAYAVLGSIPA